MSVINEAEIKVGSYIGKGEVEYFEEDNRLALRKATDHVFVGAMFGLIGRLIANSMSSGNGKVLADFYPADISHVKVSGGSYEVVYYFYPTGSNQPYEVTIETNTYINKMIKKLFSDKFSEIVAKS